jgi:inosine-uridine nucleoside N-ribohydrolase
MDVHPLIDNEMAPFNLLFDLAMVQMAMQAPMDVDMVPVNLFSNISMVLMVVQATMEGAGSPLSWFTLPLMGLADVRSVHIPSCVR